MMTDWCMILIDLQKNFDTIDHDILSKKFGAIDFSNHAISWFKSCLSNWLFRVNLENCYSDSSNITCEVTQEFILGPSLFLIFVNDMPQAVKSNLFLYADGSCLVFSGKACYKNLKNNQTEIFTDLVFTFVKTELNL